MMSNLHFDPWLTQRLQKDAYLLSLDEALVRRSQSLEAPEIVDLKRLLNQPVFISCKVATADLPWASLLEDLGFRLVDTAVLLEKPLGGKVEIPAGRAEVRWAKAADRKQVMAVAGRSFRFSRFHLDVKIPTATAHRLKAEWAGNFFTGGRGEAMLVAVVEDRVAAFLLLLQGPEKDVTIDLMAVDPDHRQVGLASHLIAQAMVHYGDQGRDRMLVGTQIANVPSLRLYEKLGFRVCATNYVFHYHGPGSRV
jgi:ribosomal protein S18 acetylase RimI-like enzyme